MCCECVHGSLISIINDSSECGQNVYILAAKEHVCSV